MKLFRNTTAVLVLTLFTGLAVFTAIQLGGRLVGTPTASAQTVTTQSATGESFSESGHGQGSSGTTQADPSGQSSDGSTQTDPYGYGGSSSSDGSSSGQTYTCPATGCTASTCHATQ